MNSYIRFIFRRVYFWPFQGNRELSKNETHAKILRNAVHEYRKVANSAKMQPTLKIPDMRYMNAENMWSSLYTM